MARQQSQTRSRIEYAVVAAVAAFFSILPYSIGRILAYAGADVWRRFNRRHRQRAVDQSMARLGIGREEAEALIKKNYRHYAMIFFEVTKLRSMSPEELRSRTNLNGCDKMIQDALAQGKGLVTLTGHLGNWEWGCAVMGMLGAASGAIARPLDNPYIDNYVNRIREKTGVTVWSKFNCVRRAANVLKRGEGFMAVVDQDGGRRGCMVPFLGELGSTMTTPVDLAIRFGAPVYAGAVMRDVKAGPGHFILESGQVHWPRMDRDPEAERMRLLTAVNADLSEIIRKYPEQWIWIHKRWKTTTARNPVPEPMSMPQSHHSDESSLTVDKLPHDESYRLAADC